MLPLKSMSVIWRAKNVWAVFGNSAVHRLQAQQLRHKSDASLDDYSSVFHFPYVSRLAFFARLKIYVTGMSFGIAPFVFNVADTNTATAFAGLLFVSANGLLLIGEFTRRVIGIIYLHKDNEIVRIAHTTFWGRRKDINVKLEDFKFVSETSANINDAFWKVEFYDKSLKTMFISTRFGGINDINKFHLIFGSESTNQPRRSSSIK